MTAPAPLSRSASSSSLAPPASASPTGGSASASASPASPLLFSDDSSLPAFLQAGLPLLYKYASKKHEKLRAQCVEALSRIKAEEKERREKAEKG